VVADSAPTSACPDGGITVTDGGGDIGYVCNGAAGDPGAPGPSGSPGSPGPSGSPGTGATVAALATGDPNCSNGGASITDGSGDVAYACNGVTGSAGPAGPAGTAGQGSSTVVSTSALTLTTGNTAPTVIPGLADTVTVSASSILLISTHGGVATDSSASTGFSDVAIEVLIDDVVMPVSDNLFEGVLPVNNTGITGAYQNWSFDGALTALTSLAPGQHTIQVAARDQGEGATATVAGNSESLLQGSLTVTILNT
jgi:hypothetical protein